MVMRCVRCNSCGSKKRCFHCDAFVKISSSGVFLFLSCSFVVMIYFGPFFGGRWTHDVPRWLDSWQPLGQRLYQNCRAPNLMKKTDSQRRTYLCITEVFFCKKLLLLLVVVVVVAFQSVILLHSGRSLGQKLLNLFQIHCWKLHLRQGTFRPENYHRIR